MNNNNNICEYCLDKSCLNCTMDNINESIIVGKSSKTIVDVQIDIKEFLITIITNPEFVEQTRREINVLRSLRDMQQND